MSKLVVELESIKRGFLTLNTEPVSSVALEMKEAAPGGRSLVAITSEQFKLLAYDIEAHSEGKYGINPPDLLVHVRDVESGDVERVDFQTALGLLGYTDDAAAKSLQEADALAAKARLAARAAEAQGGAAALVAAGGGAEGFQKVAPLTES